MSKLLKILGVLVVLVVAVIVGGIAMLKSMDFNEYRGLIAEQVKSATGRDLVIKGDLNLEISLSPALAVEGVTFANASWGSRKEMVKLNKFATEIDLIPLITGDIRVKRLVLTGLDILAETDAKGRGNWEFATPGEKKAETGGGKLPVVQKVTLRDVRLTYKDGGTGKITKAVIDSLDVSASDASSPLEVALKGQYDSAAYDVTGQMGAINLLLSGGKPYPINLKGNVLGVGFSVDGAIAKPREAEGMDLKLSARGSSLTQTVTNVQPFVPALKELKLPDIGPFDVAARIQGSAKQMSVSDLKLDVGRADLVKVTATGGIKNAISVKGIDITFNVEGKDIRPFSSLAKSELPALPPFSIAGRARDSGGGYSVDGIDAKLGGNDLKGSAAVNLSGARPRLEANLSSTRLNVDELLPQDEKKGPKTAAAPAKKSPDGRVFSADPLPLEGLKAADVKVKYAAKSLTAGGLTVTDVSVDLNLAGGRLEIRPFAAVLSGGKVEGSVLLDGAKATPTLSVMVNGKQVDYGQLLKQFDVTDIAEGRIDLDTDIRGAGNSVRALMAGLNGRTRITSKGGKLKSNILNIVSADLTSALPMVDSKGDKDIRCIVVHFDIKTGKANAKTFLFETGGMSLIGVGGANLANETLALKFDPRAKKASVLKAAIPFSVGGTFASPSVAPDITGAAVGTVTGAVKGVTDLASGGVGAVTGLLGGSKSGGAGSGSSVDSTDYCQLAFAGKPLVATKTAAPASSQPSSTATQPPPPVTKDADLGKTMTDSIKKGAGSLGKTLDGLFGK